MVAPRPLLVLALCAGLACSSRKEPPLAQAVTAASLRCPDGPGPPTGVDPSCSPGATSGLRTLGDLCDEVRGVYARALGDAISCDPSGEGCTQPVTDAFSGCELRVVAGRVDALAAARTGLCRCTCPMPAIRRPEGCPQFKVFRCEPAPGGGGRCTGS